MLEKKDLGTKQVVGGGSNGAIYDGDVKLISPIKTKCLIEPDTKNLDVSVAIESGNYCVLQDTEYSNKLRANIIMLSGAIGVDATGTLNKNTGVAELMLKELTVLLSYYKEKYFKDIDILYENRELLWECVGLESFFEYANIIDDKMAHIRTMLQYESIDRAKETINLLNTTILVIRIKQDQLLLEQNNKTNEATELKELIERLNKAHSDQMKYKEDRAMEVECRIKEIEEQLKQITKNK